MINYLHIYNNLLCIEATALYDDLMVMSLSNYKWLASKGKLNKIVKGGNGRTALVEYDSLPQRFKDKIYNILGCNPRELLKTNVFKSFIKTDVQAENYFRDYELESGKRLPEKNRKEYIANAIILNACHLIISNTNARRKAMGGTKVKGIWDKLTERIEELPTYQYPHSLPKNTRSLKNKYNKYQKQGFEGLIHKNFQNKNSEKLSEESKFWILARWSNQVNKVVSIPDMHRKYNKKAKAEGWKCVKNETTIYNFLYDEEVQPLWWGHRYGEQAYKEKLMYQFSTRQPSMRDSLWYSDGTKMNFFYQENGVRKSCQVYEVMDAFSEVLLGYHISPTENYEAQFNAYKMAVQVAGHRPYQIGMDNQGGHKKLEAGNFLAKLSKLQIATQPYNGKSKTIESAFGRFQQQIMKQDWFFTGQNITAKNIESKANVEFILENSSELPTLKEAKEIYAKRRKEWNQSTHFKTGKPRLEMYLSSSNPETPKVEIWDMVDIFWVQRPKTVKLNAYGLMFKDGDKKYNYMKVDHEKSPDIDWLELNIGKDFTIKYDPSDLSSIMVYEDTPLGLRFVTEMVPKTTVSRGKQEQEDFETAFIHKTIQGIKDKRVARKESTDQILKDHGMHPEQHGLNSPRISGIQTTKTSKDFKPKNKTPRVPKQTTASIQKKVSNMTLDDFAGL
ncbi:MAG: hypothetical protein ACPGSD_07910 [Flavobacteriales bacterium]